MKRLRFEIGWAAALLALYAAFFLWQTPGLVRGRLEAGEIEAYLAAIDASLEAPADVKSRLLAGLRAWGLRDDARPVYMLNLMRYHAELQRFGGAPDFAGSPEESNAHYEAVVMPLALRDGDYPLYAGAPQGSNLVGHDAANDGWSRVLLMRYPSRRHFFALLANPAYGPVLPYKLAALELVLVPTTGEIVLPELRLAVGAGLLVLFFGVAWLRACLASRRGGPH